jgi:hypothetical protein
MVDVADLDSLLTQAADLEAETWGIALLNLQADLPDDSEDNLSLVIFGDAEIASAVTDDADSEFSAPMQAITLRSSTSDSCEAAPDGLLIRSPEGHRTRVMVNGVELTLSSATYITADANSEMVIEGLEGQIEVTAQGQTETITAGFITRVALDENFEPASPPTTPEPVEPTVEFPFDVFSGIFPDAVGTTDASTGGTSAGLTNTYNGSSYTFNYPQEWAVLEIPSGSPSVVLSNTDVQNVDLANFPPNTIVVFVYSLADFAAAVPDTVTGSTPDAILRSYAQQPFLNIASGPATLDIGSHSVTRLEFGDSGENLVLLFYGFGDLIFQEFVSPDAIGVLDQSLQDIIATFSFGDE